jgi:hypothetical protein
MTPSPRPAHICAQLLAALEATEGRRRRRKRDTTPDAIGIAIKRQLLEGAVRDDPEPGDLADWRLAKTSDRFRGWLEEGAPSADAG